MKRISVFFLVLIITSTAYNASAACGGLLGTYFKLEPNGKVSADETSYSKSEFCDEGQNELNSNFKIQLLIDGKKITEKNVFISERSFIETHDKKTGNVALVKKAKQQDVHALVKFSIPNTSSTAIQYQVYKISNNKLVGEGIIPLKE